MFSFAFFNFIHCIIIFPFLWWTDFLIIFIFTLFYFTILYWFCHILTWIHHRCSCVPIVLFSFRFYLVLSNDFSLLGFSFCFCVFLFILFHQTVFSYSSLIFIKTATVDSLMDELEISMSLGLVVGRLLWSFNSVIFPLFYTFLEVLQCCICICCSSNSSSHCWLTLGKKYLPSVLIGSLNLFSPSVDMPAPRFLLPLVAEFLSLYVLFPPSTQVAGCWQPPFCFPKGGA